MSIFKPFFKTQDFDSDYLPSPPILTNFDKRILKLCGKFGYDNPTKEQFLVMLNEEEYDDEVYSIYKKLNYQVVTSSQIDIETFRKDLADVWFGESTNGFKYIFCGKIDDVGMLGGMHFAERIPSSSRRRMGRGFVE